MTRILVVEDDSGIAMALEDDLRAEGYDVIVATDGVTATTKAIDEGPDAILLDVMLPQKDGFAVCRDVRAAGVRAPIILLTARTAEPDKILGLETGADDYVTKPYSPGELRARVKAALRRSSEVMPDVFRFGDAEVDFSRRELRRAGVPVPMTPLEFRLLETFIRHRGRALARQRLIDEAWGRDTFVTDRVVDNQVTNLRKKIEPTPSAPVFLNSIRGFGYRFDPS
ncbi:MAG TPA: response regulator transcription factor [Vicinamibacterales bacterium]|nr:response regulator transcription factor [Vicinamibacterales bacterium]